MTLLLGTAAGLYAAPDGVTAAPDRVLDAAVNRLRRFEGHGVLAATDDGLYQSVGGREWDHLATFEGPTVSVLGTPDGSIYAGTRPAEIHRSTDGGATWEPLGLRDVPDSERWADRAFRDGAQVRTLASDPADDDRLLAGIEPGGVVVSPDRGDTWRRQSRGCHDDVHHLLPVDGDTYIASTGNGCYRTDDGGETWLRVDTDFREFWCNYHREAAVHEGTLFTAARAWGPEAPGAMVLEHGPAGEDRDGAERFDAPRRIEPSGAPDEFVCSFAAHMGRLLAGTMVHRDGFQQAAPARVALRKPDGIWETLGQTPAGVRSLVGI